jgi:nucleotide-binding universal stress UspA family protein
MSRIVVGIDGSPNAQRALEWAVGEAAVRRVPLTVITVYSSVVSFWGGAVEVPPDSTVADKARADAREAADKALAAALAGDEQPESVTFEAISGQPADELIRASQDADLIVVGSRGTGGFARLLLGSVGTQVAYHAHCPAVIIPADDRR